ncbi:MAG: 2-dehydropantoate 2-reductase [Ramlibacter sp.]|nr:2-dehydropantoate 2-reductase [Ramlibacter sp.]
MKIAVMGAGAVGCYYGGLLARAGHDVTLIARPSHVDAIRERGLHMETRTFDEFVPLRASSDPSAVKDAQVVLFCVKSMDTESAGLQIHPHLSPGALVMTLQNGVDNADRLRTVITDREVAATVVYVGTEMLGPGHVKHHGRGELTIEPSHVSVDVAAAFMAAGIPTTVSDNVCGALWVKLILNCAYNAVSAITQLPYGRAVEGVGVLDVMRDVVDECKAVAKAEGITLAGDVDLAIRKIIETMPNQYSSTAQDLARGRPTEIDYLNGLVVRRGQAHGVSTPANQVLWSLVKLMETKRDAQPL